MPAPVEYSLVSLIRRLALPEADLQPGKREGEAEATLGKGLADEQPESRRIRGVLLPGRALAELGADGIERGGSLVGSRIELADAISPDTVLSRLGVRFPTLRAGDTSLVTVAMKAKGWWVSEGELIPDSDPFAGEGLAGGASFGWSDLGSRVVLTRRLLKQGRQVEGEVRGLLRRTIAAEVEDAGINGTGGKQPHGLLSPAHEIPVATTTGALPTRSEITTAVQSVTVGGKTGLERVKILASGADFDSYMNTAGLVREGDNGELSIAGRPLYFSPYLPTGRTILGDFSQYVMPFFGLPDLTVNPFLADFTQTSITIWQSVGSAVSRPELLRVLQPAG